MTIRVSDPSDMPLWKVVQPYFRSVRLYCTADQNNIVVTTGWILNFQSMVATITTSYSFAYAFRIKRIRIWGAPAIVAGLPSTVSIEWNAGTTGFLLDGVSVSNQSTSTEKGPFLSSRPPVDSLAGWYQAGVSGFTNQICNISMPNHSIIQFDYDWVPNWSEAAFASTTIGVSIVGTVLTHDPLSTVLVMPNTCNHVF
jgi:hypothetical protein